MGFNFFGNIQEPAAVADPATAQDSTNDDAASAPVVSPAVEPGNAEDVSRFEKLFPSFVGCYDALSPDMRAKMLYDKIEATSPVAKPSEAEGDGAPSIRAVPQLNMEMATATLAQAIQDGDTEAITAAQKAITDHQEQLMGVVHDYNMQNSYETQKLQKQMTALQLPTEIRAAGAAVNGFEDADVATAQQLLDSGHIQDIGVAVKFAVHQRLVASNSTVPPTVAEETARQTKAAVAASAPDSVESAGAEEIVATETFTDQRFVNALKQEAAAEKQTQT
jgi:hypothetical protein